MQSGMGVQMRQPKNNAVVPKDTGTSDVLIAFLMSKWRGRRFHMSLPGNVGAQAQRRRAWVRNGLNAQRRREK